MSDGDKCCGKIKQNKEVLSCYSILGNLGIPSACHIFFFFFWLKIYLFILYLFLAVLGLCCCVQAFSSCGKRRLLFIALHVLLITVASLVADHGL